MTGFRRTRITI